MGGCGVPGQVREGPSSQGLSVCGELQVVPTCRADAEKGEEADKTQPREAQHRRWQGDGDSVTVVTREGPRGQRVLFCVGSGQVGAGGCQGAGDQLL